MKPLGAILAGGKARRFGSDKAHALLEGRRLIVHVADRMRAQCSALIVCGREEPGFDCIGDRPRAGLGPLAGLCAALHHAAKHGHSHVLSAGVDAPDLPIDLVSSLRGEGAAIVRSQPVIGLWPACLAGRLDEFLASGGRALHGFADASGARRIALDPPPMNVNRPADLD